MWINIGLFLGGVVVGIIALVGIWNFLLPENPPEKFESAEPVTT